MNNSKTNSILSSASNYIKKNFSSVGSIVLALIGICVVWSRLTPYFFTFANFKNISVYIAANGIMAAGLTVVLLMGGIDLSQMALMALSGMCVAIGYENGASGLTLILIAILAGLLGGLFNAFLITKLRIMPFIATLGSQLVFRALAFISTSGRYVTIKDPLIKFVGFGSVLGLPTLLLIMLVVYIIVWFVLKYTQYGRNVYSVGSSAPASFLSGVNIQKERIISYVICGACSGLASILYIAQGSVALNNAGTGNELDIIAGVILGGLSMSGGKGSVVNTLLGILLMAVIANGMSLLSVSSYYQMLLRGVILLAAIFLDTIRGKGSD
ncbi:MAG TPA: ribose ABC transporter permease [Anaerolineaceae bacterium]|nr:ribose ABC transporter permease [Anaerolineaceae bacterium]